MKMRRRSAALLLLLALTAVLRLPALAADVPAAATAEEVIYARLSAEGTPEAAYAVVALNSRTAGTLSHYGSYTQVKNLTSAGEIRYSGGRVQLTAPAGRSYYQGDLEKPVLPWLVEINYTLDGAAVAPENLGGRSGALEIAIRTRQNPAADEDFYEHYLLQVTVTLDSALCTDIRADGGTVANAGSDKAVSFTVLPGSEGDLTLSAQVEDFRMDGISLAALPYDLADAVGDTAALTDGLTQLTDAVSALSEGAAALSGGAAALRSGAGSYGAGLSALSDSSAGLTAASAQISGALTQLAGALTGQGGGGEGPDLTALTQLPAGLRQLAAGLTALSGGMQDLAAGYAAACGAMAQAVSAIPAGSVTESDIAALMAAAPQSAALAALVENYQAAQTVRGTWAQTEGAFAAVNENLPAFAASADTMAASLEDTAGQIEAAMAAGGVDLSGLAELASGLAELSASYAQFHAGLTDYTGGVDSLAANWGQLSAGVTDLAQGASELSQGADRLDVEAQTIPDQVEALTGGGEEAFQPHSFLDTRNGDTSSVQFVLTTQSIERPEALGDPTQEIEPPGFFQTLWNKITALFK